jgi:hypothetical protein
MRFCAIVLSVTDFASVCVYLIMNAGKPADKWLVLSVNCLSPAYRATLLFICFVTHAAERDMRKNLVEVFARVRVNLQLLKGKIAGKRAGWRTR